MFHKIIEEQMEALKGFVKNEAKEKSLGGFTKESWANWLNHKSNKERWIEAEERSEEAEIDEGGEELDEEDEEKIADAVDTEDLGAKADYEYSKDKDERAMG